MQFSSSLRIVSHLGVLLASSKVPTTRREQVNVRRSFVRITALTVVVAMPLMGMSGIASAKVSKAAPKVCLTHPHKAKCKNSGAGGATGGAPGSPQITVEADPNPLVETGQSEVHVVIQVETLPSFAGDKVNVDSTQLAASCSQGLYFESVADSSGYPVNPVYHQNQISLVLDDDGNATVIADGTDCAPGTSVIEADLEVAPFLTALTTLTALPPNVTPVGITGFPTVTVGGQTVSGEVETGDTSTSGDSDVYAVFYVEDNPVYAEQLVEISSPQLEGRCIRGWIWEAGNYNGIGVGAPNGSPSFTVTGIGVNTGAKAETVLDDDGNAVFVFKGISCAAGPSEVIADVKAGTHDTFVSEFTVVAPTPTI
jgi:hypothetical protein